MADKPDKRVNLRGLIDMCLINAVEEIDLKDLLLFFDAKVSPQCPLCQHDQWEVPSSNGMVIGLGYISAICKNCGFVRQHSEDVVREWLKENA